MLPLFSSNESLEQTLHDAGILPLTLVFLPKKFCPSYSVIYFNLRRHLGGSHVILRAGPDQCHTQYRKTESQLPSQIVSSRLLLQLVFYRQ